MDNIAIERENVTKFLGVFIDENFLWKQPLLKQLYFSVIHCHLNYPNIAWASTYQSKLEGLYHHQKHATRIINFKDKFTHLQPLFHDMKALNIFQINLFHTMFKCKREYSSSYFP